MAVDDSAPKVSVTMTLKKYDHTGETPRLFEIIVSKDGKIISKESYDDESKGE